MRSELELFVDDLGFTPAAALRAATETNAGFMTGGDRIGALEAGPRRRFHRARRLAARRYPRAAGQAAGCARSISPARRSRIADRPYDPRQVTDFALSNWTDLYTQARVAELGAGAPPPRRRVGKHRGAEQSEDVRARRGRL